MVHKTLWKIVEEEERPCLEEEQRPPLEPGPDGGLVSEHLVARFATEPGRAQPEQATWHTPPLRPVGAPIAEGWVSCHMGGSESQGSRRTRPEWQKLALGTWNVTRGGKEPELVREVECYKLDLVGLTSTHPDPEWSPVWGSNRGLVVAVLGDFNAHVGNNGDT